ncbi:DUF6479 family protein [Streptomyces sp. NPDC047123]|uniref:DUF6479 family protein n=1 Tax=unclassified Streptomyces TaxID=2593676 RepID=UPI0033E9BBD5
MQTHSNTVVLAASGTTSLLLVIVGVVVVAGLLAMFVVGRRRSARHSATSTPVPKAGLPDEAPQRGVGWQTPDDDPEQGHPHR